MKNTIGRLFEFFLISGDFLAVGMLPIVAGVCGLGVVFGSGILGNPDLPENVLPDSYTATVQPALAKADGAAYAGWAGVPSEMSSFIKDAINENLRMADTDDDFVGEAFAEGLKLTALGEAPVPSAPAKGKPGSSASPEAKAAPAGPLEASKDALDRWSKRYWCTRQGWDANWSQNIVRPLVARGVGGCSGWQRFEARSPIAARIGLWPGIITIFFLCLLAGVCMAGFSAQILLREAYQLTYKSKVMGE